MSYGKLQHLVGRTVVRMQTEIQRLKKDLQLFAWCSSWCFPGKVNTECHTEERNRLHYFMCILWNSHVWTAFVVKQSLNNFWLSKQGKWVTVTYKFSVLIIFSCYWRRRKTINTFSYLHVSSYSSLPPLKVDFVQAMIKFKM